jgi:hypothetical protein
MYTETEDSKKHHQVMSNGESLHKETQDGKAILPNGVSTTTMTAVSSSEFTPQTRAESQKVGRNLSEYNE